MKLKETLEEIKKLLKESDNKTNKEFEELKSELETVKSKLNSQNSRLALFLNKLDDIKQTNVESATLLEEMAFCLLEEEPIINTQDEIKDKTLKNVFNEKEKYIN